MAATHKASYDFTTLHAYFMEKVAEAFTQRDVSILEKAHHSIPSSDVESEKKSPLDQALREYLVFHLIDNIDGVGYLVQLSVEAVRANIVTYTIPVVLLGDIFDAVTLDKCERIFTFVEDMVEIWKEDIFYTHCKNNILRMCNDLLRRLSRAQNTVFCGRILLFLSKFFPFSERSGLNIVSEFNLDNVTEYGTDGKDLDDTLEDTVEDIPIKIDYNLYCKFWSLQDFFRNPNQCYSKAQWKMFQTHAATILEAFASFKLEEHHLSSTPSNNKQEEPLSPLNNFADNGQDEKMECSDNTDLELMEHIRNNDHFFAKFLTNPKLLALQLSDANFRRSVLVQFLILFQYLQLTVKFKTESNTLTTAQSEFIKETETKVFKLLEETPPNGKRFARTVQHMLTREEMWNNWKNEGCKEFKKPTEDTVNTTSLKKMQDDTSDATKSPTSKRALKRPLGDSLKDASHAGKFFLGNDVLTKIWNYCPDNLQACKSEERNFLPQLEPFLNNPREKSDPSFEWRALRLLARQSPHFFTFLNSPSYKISDYLEGVRRKLAKDRMESTKVSAGGTHIENGQNGENGKITDNNEQETVALQEQDNEQDGDGDADGDTDLVEEDVGVQNDIEKHEIDDGDAHAKSTTATREHIEEIAPLIGDDWKKLGKKLGYAADELLYFETENKNRDGACNAMLSNWFTDDDDANLDNLAYILEGLEINTAANAVKALIEKLNPKDNKSGDLNDDGIETLSDS